jgi:hypothetical protein
MANNIAFQAMGKTHKANATTTSQTITITADSPCNQLLVSSHESTQGGKPVYFVVSANSAVTCVVPTNGSPQYSMLVSPGNQMVYTVPQQFTANTNMYIAFLTESTTSECYFTPGEGMA